jgi:hypothetical protein
MATKKAASKKAPAAKKPKPVAKKKGEKQGSTGGG